MSDTKIIIAGTMVTFVSPHTLEELQTVSRYKPTALCLYEDDVLDFAIFPGKGDGAIDSSAIMYGATTPDGTGHACASVPLPDYEGKNPATVVAEVFGPSVVKMNKIEEQVNEALAEVGAMMAKVTANISIS